MLEWLLTCPTGVEALLHYPDLLVELSYLGFMLLILLMLTVIVLL
jgi:hypothetical protein